MSWNKQQIDDVALASAPEDYEAFEKIALSELPFAHVLDAGCFDGYNTVLKFKPYDNIERVVGIDPIDDYLEQARRQTDDRRFSWELASIETYAGAAETFDLVYFSHVFQHVADKETALENAFRLLNPGGWIVIKTFDDSVKISYPDPDNVMKRLFELYETKIIGQVPHTRHTDRNNGQKCYTLLKRAGFTDIDITIHTTDTANKTLAERMELFERFTYFRSKPPKSASKETVCQLHDLLAAWKELFTHDDYYHASNTFMVVARKPGYAATQPETRDVSEADAAFVTSTGASYTMHAMSERDLGMVMRIELDSFEDPWTPVAYAMDLRHNPYAHYCVLKDEEGTVQAYLGWWKMGAHAVLMHIAVDTAHRKEGLGKRLLLQACTAARANGCTVMQLNVRKRNTGARAFYASLGFVERGIHMSYYTAPADDAVFMEKSLDFAM